MTIPTQNPTQATEPRSFSATPQINGTILFSWQRPIVQPARTVFQIIRSTSSVTAGLGTVVWEGDGNASPLPLVMPASLHWYYMRAYVGAQNTQWYSPYTPNTFGIGAVAYPESDNTQAARLTPDAEFTLSTDNGSYWIWSNSQHGSISLTGGDIGGKFTFTAGSDGFNGMDLYARRSTGYPAIHGQPWRLLVRYRRTTAVAANLGLDPQFRVAILAVSSVTIPPPSEGGVTEFVIYPQSATLNTWTTVTAPFSTQLNTSSVTPYMTARVRFPLNYLSSGTIELDAVNAFQSL